MTGGELFLRPSPRAFFLITDTHALVFRQPEASESRAARSVVVAEFVQLEDVDLHGLISVGSRRSVVGVLGVTSVPTARSPIPEIFLIFLSYSVALPPLLPSSPLRPAKVAAVEFHSLSSSFWDPPNLSTSSGYDDDDDPYRSQPYSTPSSTQSQAAQQGVENPCQGMRKYLESGGFFFAEDCAWDISTRMGEVNYVQADAAQHPLESFDERFVWNANLLEPFLKFRAGLPADVREILDEQKLLIPVIQGYCGSKPITTGSWTNGGKPEMASLGLISRLSWKRAGARFMTRGIDDDGQVANFVETEVILATESACLSYVQVRGSVPLFWQQPAAGLATLQQKVEITRPPQASQPAFDKHFLDLLEHYHSVHAVNLLGQRDAESMLSAAYSEHMRALKRTLQQTPASEKIDMDANPSDTVQLTPYDFHAVSKQDGPDSVKYDFQSGLREVVESMRNFGWTAIDGHTGQVVESQRGIFRVNCLDCLDRTNFVQDVISSITLSHFLESMGSPLGSSPTLWQAHRELWADNGDRLSKIYAGTGALNTSATRTGKKTFAGLLSDATKSVGRAYITNFQDKGKQGAIDMLLGMMEGQRPVILFDPVGDSVQSELAKRINEYSETRTVSIFSGTWNLNGEKPGESLDEWLFPANSSPADIYMIAFQEIVQLTAGQILQTDPAKRRMWEEFIMSEFSRRNRITKSQSKYILYRSEQLVGTALIIVVKSDLTPHIRQVESATKKTGLQGLSGNKGGVGIRFNLFDSTVCLMTCHLAAGHSNVAERNADYKTISKGLKFSRGKTIDKHDIVIWGADFNYRISLPNLDVREYAETSQLDPLLASDQLFQSMDEGEVFVGYEEGPITFQPTYKYDNGTDQYDTSEKQRIPAWTDRILFKGPALRLKDYNRAELYSSDHRPVYAYFDATIRQVDQAKKNRIADEITRSIRTGGLSVKLDDKVEGALRNGRLVDLPSQMTRRGISSPSPRLPPRPSSVASNRPNGTPTQSAPTRKPAPPVPDRAAKSSVAATSESSSLPVTYTARRKPVPPTIPSNGSAPSEKPAHTRQPPSLPPRSGSSSSSMTSAPPRPRPSLDMDAPPPDGLLPPVQPDQPSGRSSPKSPVPSFTRATKTAANAISSTPSSLPTGSFTSSSPISSNASSPSQTSSRPLVITRGAGMKITAPSITGARSPPAPTVLPTKPSSISPEKPKVKPLVPARKPSITANDKPTVAAANAASGKAPPPIVPKKPVALRSTSNTGSRQ